MKKTNKSVLLIILICFVFSLLLLFLFCFNVKRVSKIDANEYTIVNSDDYIYKIEKVEKLNNELSIEGYLYKKNTSIKIIATHLVLKSKDDTYYKIPTYVKYREDLENDYDVSWSGFVSKLNINKFDKEDNYDLYVLSEINEETSLIDLNVSLEGLLNNVK